MKILNKQEIRQIAFNQDFMNLYKKCTVKKSSFLVIDTTLASDSFSRFTKESFRNNKKTNYDN